MLRTAVACFALSALPALAAPSVATDITPVEMLVARVMDGVGAPAEALVPPGADPHSLALKPSQARALQNADVVFWIGEEMTPWLEGPLDTLAENARIVTLIEADGIELLEVREGLGGHDDHGDEEHAEGEHDEHAHEEHAEGEHKDHAEEEHVEADHDDHGHEGHAHTGTDPHAWLSPENAAAWLLDIAAVLSEADAENAATYFANANAGAAEIKAAADQIETKISALGDVTYSLAHDAFHYFEDRFGLTPVAAVTDTDAVEPGPARVAAVQEAIRDAGVQCLIAEPGHGTGLVDTVLEGTDAIVVEVSPLFAEGGYVGLLNSIADAFVACTQTS